MKRGAAAALVFATTLTGCLGEDPISDIATFVLDPPDWVEAEVAVPAYSSDLATNPSESAVTVRFHAGGGFTVDFTDAGDPRTVSVTDFDIVEVGSLAGGNSHIYETADGERLELVVSLDTPTALARLDLDAATALGYETYAVIGEHMPSDNLPTGNATYVGTMVASLSVDGEVPDLDATGGPDTQYDTITGRAEIRFLFGGGPTDLPGVEATFDQLEMTDPSTGSPIAIVGQIDGNIGVLDVTGDDRALYRMGISAELTIPGIVGPGPGPEVFYQGDRIGGFFGATGDATAGTFQATGDVMPDEPVPAIVGGYLATQTP